MQLRGSCSCHRCQVVFSLAGKAEKITKIIHGVLLPSPVCHVCLFSLSLSLCFPCNEILVLQWHDHPSGNHQARMGQEEGTGFGSVLASLFGGPGLFGCLRLVVLLRSLLARKLLQLWYSQGAPQKQHYKCRRVQQKKQMNQSQRIRPHHINTTSQENDGNREPERRAFPLRLSGASCTMACKRLILVGG